MTENSLSAREWVPALMTLLGVIVGGFVATAGTSWLNRCERKAMRKSIALAFYGEIDAIIAIVKRRNYLESISGLVQFSRTTNKPVFMVLQIEQQYFEVYQNNVSRIGTLESPLNRLIPKFYTFGKSILEEIKAIQGEAFQTMSPPDQAVRLEDLHQLFVETVNLGLQIQSEIRDMYPDAVK
jgi:hypothetical protein